MSEELLRAKEAELAAQIFSWARENGLAQYVEQIRVSIRINKRADTTDLTEHDWLFILDDAHNWGPKERGILKSIKANGNQATLCEYNYGKTQGMPNPRHMAMNLKSDVLFLSVLRGSKGARILQIKKRLVAPQIIRKKKRL